jgi:hypothetical protein
VDVENTGPRAGTEVAQMYARDLVSSVTRPVKELKVFLQPGETKTAELEITSESLAFYDIRMKYTVEPGEFEIMVGNSSRDEDLQKVVLTVEKTQRMSTHSAHNFSFFEKSGYADDDDAAFRRETKYDVCRIADTQDAVA